MLSTDLIYFHRRKGAFVPVFLDVSGGDETAYASLLLDIYRGGVEAGMTRIELEETLAAAGDGNLGAKSAAGLRKVLDDRSGFSLPEECDFSAMRSREFALSAERLAAAEGSEAKYRSLLPELEHDLYGDLPDFERIVKCPFASGKELLERYNMTLAQSMLLFASSLTVELAPEDAADGAGTGAGAGEMRRIFKYLKFFRLLAEISALPGGGRRLEISGPASIFGAGRKYALALASFFPAVARLKRWKMSAELEIRGAKGVFKLDEKSNLVSHYRNFSAYVPEEIRMFHRLFEEKSDAWRIVGGGELRNPRTGNIFFPDLSFERVADGLTFHLELLHRYHAGALARRLEELPDLAQCNLILGIDRALADEKKLTAIRAGAGDAAERIFLFRDFPGVERVKSILKKSAERFEKAPDGK